MTPPIFYQIIPINPEGHLFEVSVIIKSPDLEGIEFWLPAWIPGSYMIRDFSKNIVQLSASNREGPLAVKKIDKQSWRCSPSSSEVTLRYQIYAWDLSVRGAHLDRTHAYFNGSSVFVAIKGEEDSPCEVEIIPPTKQTELRWRVATTLPALDAEEWSFGRYRADDYQTLIDHPVEMGTFTLYPFSVNDIPHALVISGRHDCDGDRLTKDLEKICSTQIALFAEAPFKRYLFQLMVVGNGYGGLEHRDSTSLICSRDDLPFRGMRDINDGYRQLLGLFSHEYFHSWNIKQIKPAIFIPYDLTKESYTPLLWAFEGFTSYYDDLMLLRSGVIDQKGYLELLGQSITRLMQGSGRLHQSVTDSSLDAWTKFYKQDENAPNAIVSYYIKGGLIALILDLIIRASKREQSMDDLMRQLWLRFGKPSIGIETESLLDLINEIAGSDLSELMQKLLYTTSEIPLEEVLRDAGIALKQRASQSVNDKGGKPASEDIPLQPGIGIRYRSGNSDGVEITHIFSGSAAEKGGLAAQDRIIAMNSLECNCDNFEPRLQRLGVGNVVRCHYFRRDELRVTELTLEPPAKNSFYLETIEGKEALYADWLITRS